MHMNSFEKVFSISLYTSI